MANLRKYSSRDWYLKLLEKIFAAVMTYQSKQNFLDANDYDIEDYSFPETAEQIANLVADCISWLECLGFDEKKRSQLFQKINQKNFPQKKS